MVTTHRISADLYFEDFELIAVRSDMQDYTMAYHLNDALNFRLARREKDLTLQDGLRFSVYEWIDPMNDTYWLLISNHCRTETTGVGIGLFEKETATVQKHLVNERKEVDYFLKVETEMPGLPPGLIKNIKNIAGIMTAYRIDADTLKSKKNLIF